VKANVTYCFCLWFLLKYEEFLLHDVMPAQYMLWLCVCQSVCASQVKMTKIRIKYHANNTLHCPQ